jgi:hypothetical protein
MMEASGPSVKGYSRPGLPVKQRAFDALFGIAVRWIPEFFQAWY